MLRRPRQAAPRRRSGAGAGVQAIRAPLVSAPPA